LLAHIGNDSYTYSSLLPAKETSGTLLQPVAHVIFHFIMFCFVSIYLSVLIFSKYKSNHRVIMHATMHS